MIKCIVHWLGSEKKKVAVAVSQNGVYLGRLIFRDAEAWSAFRSTLVTGAGWEDTDNLVVEDFREEYR